MRRSATTLLVTLTLGVISHGLDLGSTAAIKSSAQSVADRLNSTYATTFSGSDASLIRVNSTWWDYGAITGSLIDYWALTGDSSFNPQVQKAILSQAKGSLTFVPSARQSKASFSDQAIWALAALSAYEQKFPAGASESYLLMATSVFDQQAERWDNTTCDGGFNSTITQTMFPQGQKDALSVGSFFQLAARLAFNTQNNTYVQWADRAYNWAVKVGIVNERSYDVYEGTEAVSNCSPETLSHTQWSVNAATFLYGSALLYNVTYTQTWISRTQGSFTSLNNSFFPKGVVREPVCDSSSCTTSRRTYNAMLMRWLARTAISAPFLTATIQSMMDQSAESVIRGCDGDTTCSVDGKTGLSEQLIALDAVLALLVGRSPDTVTTTSSSGSSIVPSATSSGGASSQISEWSSWAVICVVLLLYCVA
ncbi:glycoside hydrolase [Tothia fuscella]|uniref:Mannan endo-1,6-alpha-mannosidase n=1 Tax=Tothia fuscella TaxID=1048955 RepID=A0A9P4P1K4_9PEZI|nr:glycoside hydrolase [Tothia fuscella]